MHHLQKAETHLEEDKWTPQCQSTFIRLLNCTGLTYCFGFDPIIFKKHNKGSVVTKGHLNQWHYNDKLQYAVPYYTALLICLEPQPIFHRLTA